MRAAVCRADDDSTSVLCHLKVCNNCVGFFRLSRRKTAGIIALFQGLSTKTGGKRQRKDCMVLGDTVHQAIPRGLWCILR